MNTRLLCLMGYCSALLPGADLTLPPPSQLEISEHGGVLIYHMQLPGGEQRIELPAHHASHWQVLGASGWSIIQQVSVEARPMLPKALVDLLLERNRIVASTRLLADRSHALQAVDADISGALARLAHADVPQTPAWQQALDADLAAHQALDADQLALEQSRTQLLLAAAAIAPLPAQAQDLMQLGSQDPLVLDADTLAQCWRELPLPSRHVTVAMVQVASPAAVEIRELRSDLDWKPSATVVVQGSQVSLHRNALITKSSHLDLGVVPTSLYQGAADPGVELPRVHPVALVLEEVTRPVARLVGSTVQPADWSLIGSPTAPAAAPTTPVAPATETTPAATDGSGASMDALDQAPAAKHMYRPASLRMQHFWNLGALALPAASDQVLAPLPEMAITVESDGWVLIPEIAPLLVRRIGIRLSGDLPQELLGLVVDGVMHPSDSIPESPAGTLLTLRAGEDQSVFVGSQADWDIDPATQSTSFQRHGRDYWLWNASTAVRTITAYLTIPLSHSKEVGVVIDPASTGGYDQPEPGVLRWSIILPPGVPTRLGLGYRLTASGGLKL